VKPDSLSIVVPNPAAKPNPNIVAAPRLVTVARLDAREVKDGYNEFDILYSGRSSWRDVQSVPKDLRWRGESLGITLKSGESVQGVPVDSTDSQLSVKQSKIGRDIAKADIALVDYIRIKPIPENRSIEFPTEIFDPRIWPFIFRVGALMRVPLFNAALPEDDEFFQCVFHH
jgi:hypothetical protein